MVSKQYKKHIIIALILALFCFVLYYPALFGSYVWDDTLLFNSRNDLQNGKLTWELISAPVLPDTIYFRPFVFFSWYVEFHIFGKNPLISHLIGLLIFYINVFLVYLLSYVCSSKIRKNKPHIYGLIAAIIYLFHPSLVESTAWVSGRFDQLCTLFFLLGLILFSKNYKKYNKSFKLKYILLISLCFLFSMLSKDLGVVFPAVLLVFYLALSFQEENITYKKLFYYLINRNIIFIFCLFATFVFYMILRVNALEDVSYRVYNLSYVEKFIIDLLIPFHAIKYYLYQILLPHNNISLIQPLSGIDQNFYSRLISIISSGLVFLIFFYAIIKKKSFSSWMFFCVFISLFLVLYFFPIGLSSNLGHHRFLTLPLAFFSIGIVFLPISKILNFLSIRLLVQRIIIILVAAVWLFLSVVTIKSVLPFWNNEYALWVWAHKQHPDSELARYNYLAAALGERKYKEVIDFSEGLLSMNNGLEPQEQIAYANALMNIGDPESMNYYEGAIEILPKFHEMHHEDARKMADRFIMSASQIGDAYSTYAVGLLLFKNDIINAIKYLNIANWYMTKDLQSTIIFYKVAALYLNGYEKKAKEYYDKEKTVNLSLNKKDYSITHAILKHYCESEFSKTNTQCEKLKNDNPFK